MLAIRFDTQNEWWVSGKHFERLFRSALSGGLLPHSYEEWLHIAEANGGLDLSLLRIQTAHKLHKGLRAAAQNEVADIGDASPTTEDGAYAISLRSFLKAN